MLYFYTENLFFQNKLKSFIKLVLGRRNRGPQAVEHSLFTGLTELGVEFSVNKVVSGVCETACVLSGVKALEWAIKQKKGGRIKKLIAGPNIVVLPTDNNSLILSNEIDLYVVPGQLSIDFWSSLVPEFKSKLRTWPAGVEDLGSRVNKNGQALIFIKNTPKKLVSTVEQELKNMGQTFEVIRYGDYKKEDYLESFKMTKYLVYLSPVESQGLALHEAWMAGLPSLVWNSGRFEHGGMVWNGERVTAPYLNRQSGMFFYGEQDFAEKLKLFLENYGSFTPRQYSLENFTNKKSAQKYLEIIKNL
jgi:hypothetical protein